MLLGDPNHGDRRYLARPGLTWSPSGRSPSTPASPASSGSPGSRRVWHGSRSRRRSLATSASSSPGRSSRSAGRRPGVSSCCPLAPGDFRPARLTSTGANFTVRAHHPARARIDVDVVLHGHHGRASAGRSEPRPATWSASLAPGCTRNSTTERPGRSSSPMRRACRPCWRSSSRYRAGTARWRSRHARRPRPPARRARGGAEAMDVLGYWKHDTTAEW